MREFEQLEKYRNGVKKYHAQKVKSNRVFDEDGIEIILDGAEFIFGDKELPLSMLVPYKDSVIRFYSDMDAQSFLKVKTRINNNVKGFRSKDGLVMTMGAMAYFDAGEREICIDSQYLDYDENEKLVFKGSQKQVNEIIQHELHHSAGTRMKLEDGKIFRPSVSIGLIVGNGYKNVGEGVNDYFTQLSTGSGCLRDKTGYTLFSTVASILRYSTDLMTLKNSHVNDFKYLQNACKELSGSEHTLGIIEYNLEWERIFDAMAISEMDKKAKGEKFSLAKAQEYERLSDNAFYNVFDECFFNLLIPKLATVTQNERVDIINGIFSDMDDELINVGLTELLEILSYDPESYKNLLTCHRENMFNTGIQSGKKQLVVIGANGNPLKFGLNSGSYQNIAETDMKDKMQGYATLAQATKTDLKNFEKAILEGAKTGEVSFDTAFRTTLNKKITQSAIREVADKMGYEVGEFEKVKKSTVMVAPITTVDERPIINEEEKVQLAEYLSEKINEFDENQSIIRVEEEKEERRQEREGFEFEFEDDDEDDDENVDETVHEGVTEEVDTDESEDEFEDGAEDEDLETSDCESEDLYEDEIQDGTEGNYEQVVFEEDNDYEQLTIDDGGEDVSFTDYEKYV